jgi:hypothetical protein
VPFSPLLLLESLLPAWTHFSDIPSTFCSQLNPPFSTWQSTLSDDEDFQDSWRHVLSFVYNSM